MERETRGRHENERTWYLVEFMSLLSVISHDHAVVKSEAFQICSGKSNFYYAVNNNDKQSDIEKEYEDTGSDKGVMNATKEHQGRGND